MTSFDIVGLLKRYLFHPCKQISWPDLAIFLFQSNNLPKLKCNPKILMRFRTDDFSLILEAAMESVVDFRLLVLAVTKMRRRGANSSPTIMTIMEVMDLVESEFKLRNINFIYFYFIYFILFPHFIPSFTFFLGLIIMSLFVSSPYGGKSVEWHQSLQDLFIQEIMLSPFAQRKTALVCFQYMAHHSFQRQFFKESVLHIFMTKIACKSLSA